MAFYCNVTISLHLHQKDNSRCITKWSKDGRIWFWKRNAAQGWVLFKWWSNFFVPLPQQMAELCQNRKPCEMGRVKLLNSPALWRIGGVPVPEDTSPEPTHSTLSPWKASEDIPSWKIVIAMLINQVVNNINFYHCLNCDPLMDISQWIQKCNHCETI